MKRTNTLNMKRLMEDINRASNILKRNVIFEDYGMNPEEQGYDEEMMSQEGMPMEEEEPQMDEQTVDVINQIRELAIQGIAQFANDVESEQYQALKKIWLLTDKFYEGMNEDEEKSKKF